MGSAFERRLAMLRGQPESWVVTGAAGFVGSHLVETLLRHDQRVVGLDNYSTGNPDNLRSIEAAVSSQQRESFRMVEGDICDMDTCREVTVGADWVLHQAALGSVPRSIEHPLDTHRTNVDGTVNVFLSALQSGVRRVVYASSSSVYGDEPNLPKVEGRIGKPLSPYAASKRVGEIYAEVLAHSHGLSAVGLRYFNVVGPRQDPQGPYAAVVPRWIDALSRCEPPAIFGDGETTRDFCPVRNVVQANIMAATATAELAGRVYNVALGGRTTLTGLYELLRREMALRGVDCAELEPEYRDFRPGDIRHSLANIDAARRDLEYEPDVDLQSGLAATIDAIVKSSEP